MDSIPTNLMTDEDWIDQGKADAWAGKSKQTPEHDPQAASMYDLGYCEGEIERSPVQPTTTEFKTRKTDKSH